MKRSTRSNASLFALKRQPKTMAATAPATATSKRTVFARRILEHFRLDGYFDGIYGAEPGGAHDHKPELIAHVLMAQSIDPAAAVMVGDRRYDITGAHANRVRAIGVLWGYGSRTELEQAGADLLVASPAELAAALLE